MMCNFDSLEKGAACTICGVILAKSYSHKPLRNCIELPCPHLGSPIERDGVTIKVKCGCNGKEHEQPHTAHECRLYNRCLPTLVPADMAAWKERLPESTIYHLCHGCDRGGELNNG